LVHLHIFEMASAPITGELTNHWYSVVNLPGEEEDARGDDDAFAPTSTAVDTALGSLVRLEAYTGYERDVDGILHKRRTGPATLHHSESQTFTPGQVYAQPLDAAHYVETNAETGHSNLDFCSTFYVHGPKLKEETTTGRTMPMLFEAEELVEDDTIIETIPPMRVEHLRRSLQEYALVLSCSLDFWEWIFDAEQEKDRSTGLIAGYLLAERFETPAVGRLWRESREKCIEALREASDLLFLMYVEAREQQLSSEGGGGGDDEILSGVVAKCMLEQQERSAHWYQNRAPHGAVWRITDTNLGRSHLYFTQLLSKVLRNGGSGETLFDLEAHLDAYMKDLALFSGTCSTHSEYLKPYWGRVEDITTRRSTYNDHIY
jgi:hypothetical protein